MPRKAVDSEVRLHSLNLKTTESLRLRLEDAARSSGRALTHEVERRLEQSFMAGDILEKLFGGPKTFQAFYKTALFLQAEAKQKHDCTGDAWLEKADYDLAEQIGDGLRQLLEVDINMARPPVVDAERGDDDADKPLPDGVRFATPEELAEFKPVGRTRKVRPKV